MMVVAAVVATFLCQWRGSGVFVALYVVALVVWRRLYVGGCDGFVAVECSSFGAWWRYWVWRRRWRLWCGVLLVLEGLPWAWFLLRKVWNLYNVNWDVHGL